ncbi:hypothetical protein RBI13_08575 [Alcaligenaceae bacterium A4P071]|nr:hypothetical protein [Alcaligenaceae bacterium A4P071]
MILDGHAKGREFVAEVRDLDLSVPLMLAELGMTIVASPAVVFNAYLREEVQKWQRVVQANGISID